MLHRAVPGGLAVAVLTASLALAAERAVADFSIAPLTAADVAFYLAILRAAAVHNAHLTGEDRQAVTLVEATQKRPSGEGATASVPEQSGREAKLMARAAALASYDETIAAQRGAIVRYRAIKAEVDVVVASLEGEAAPCDADACRSKPSVTQTVHDGQIRAAIDADKPLIAPHEAEIVALKNEIGGFMKRRVN